MSPRSKVDLAVHVKKTPLLSKVWKEKLRQGCLERLKGRRKSPNAQFSSMPGMSTARRLLEEEMMELGVAVDSPCIDQKQPRSTNVENIMSIMIGEDPETSALVSPASLAPNTHHFISEDELFELLAEIEMEMHTADLQHYEEMLALADVEECEFEEKVSEFEQWRDFERQEGVLCPLCKDAFVKQEQNGVFICPNTMDSSCDFHITNRLGLTLTNFKERLQEAYEQHAVYCSQNLSFQIGTEEGLGSENDGTHLFAICIPCGTRMLVA